MFRRGVVIEEAFNVEAIVKRTIHLSCDAAN